MDAKTTVGELLPASTGATPIATGVMPLSTGA
jgi:hypothetical protein